MCGILTWFKRGGFTRAEVQQGIDAMHSIAHRGPDGEGVLLINTITGTQRMLRTTGTPEGLPTDLELEDYEDFSADLLLGHRRLSIIDLSLRGFQPMRDEYGNVIIFNGEVYNYIELREKLVAKGHNFTSGTDTEVVLAAYREWGRNCVNRFNGMWSLIIYSPRGNNILMTNDRFGIKPMYYYRDAENIMVMSEAKMFRYLPGGSTEVNQRYIDLFLKYGLLDTDHQTAYRKLRRMMPAHTKVIGLFDCQEKVNEKYWEPPGGSTRLNLAESTSRLIELLNESISLRLRADVPWGITLSGGLDSSLIAYRLSHVMKVQDLFGSIWSYTASFPGRSVDESHFARMVEHDLQLTAHYVEPMEHFSMDDFRRFIWHMDFPVASTSPYASWNVYRRISQTGIKMTLCGQGADELFGGYHHHFYSHAADLLHSFRWLRLSEQVMSYSSLKKLNPVSVLKTSGLTWLSRRRSPVMYAENTQLQLWQDLTQWVMPALLRYEDRSSMAWGVEARVPFLDYQIVEFAQHLPQDMKIREGWQKYIVRKALEREAPKEIVWRKDKKGYVTPETEILRTHLDSFLAFVPALKTVGLDITEDQIRASILGKGKLLAHTRLLNLGAWLTVNQVGV